MEDIRTTENQMHQDMNSLVEIADQFESAFNSRTSEWYAREVRAQKIASARNRIISWIVGAVIAVTAIITAVSVLKLS